jgi:large subunit ribosomal protein L10
MKRSEKEEIVSEVLEAARKSEAMYFTDFSGLTVAEATELRREFRKSRIDYRVVKNTLIKKALEQANGDSSLMEKLVGPTGVVFAYQDPVTPAKIIQKFNEKHQKLSLKVAVLEKHVYDGSRLKELSKLPSRGEIIAGILGSIQSPLAGVPGAVNAVIRDLVSVIDQVAQKKAA